MGVAQTGLYGIGVQIIEPDEFTEDIHGMYEYMEDLSDRIKIDVEYFETGSGDYSGTSNTWFLCIEHDFIKGVFQESQAKILMDFLTKNKIEYEGTLGCVGGLLID